MSTFHRQSAAVCPQYAHRQKSRTRLTEYLPRDQGISGEGVDTSLSYPSCEREFDSRRPLQGLREWMQEMSAQLIIEALDEARVHLLSGHEQVRPALH